MFFKENIGLKTLKNISKTILMEGNHNYITPINPEVKLKLKSSLYEPSNKINPFGLISKDLQKFSTNFTQVLTENNNSVFKIINHVVSHSGKKLRPCINLLLAHALNSGANLDVEAKSPLNDNKSKLNGLNFYSVLDKQRRLSEVTELVHTGSILHDDVVDNADSRRGGDSVRKRFGNKIAILGGDFFLSKASLSLAYIGNNEVIKLLSCAISNLVSGELTKVEVGENGFDLDRLLATYCHKNYLKTASLIANSCKGIAVLSGQKEFLECSFEYGKYLGLSFQVIDDILDVAGDSSKTGKPSNLDIQQGVYTAPILYAAEGSKAIREILSRKFEINGDVEALTDALGDGVAISKSKELAENFALMAVKSVLRLKPSVFRDALIALVRYNLERTS